MDRKIRVAPVSYLNSKPLIYGFENGEMAGEIEITFDYPANVANMLLDGRADIGLIPVAAIPKLKDYNIISDYCIGAEREVASVCLFSDVPLNKISSVFLDYQSNTSVALLILLLKNHWKISPNLISAAKGYESKIKGTMAGLVIGDRALLQRKISPYIYDLAIGWKEMTGLPFVFAAWVANRKLSESFTKGFNEATSAGLSCLEEIISKNYFPAYDLHHYYSSNISYVLNDKKREALSLFLKLIAPIP